MRWATCNYGNVNDGPCASLAATVQQIHDQITLILAGNVDGDNLSEDLFGAGIRFGGPIPAPPAPAPRPPPKIIVTLSDEKTRCWIQKKGPEAARDSARPGLELVVDASDSYGKVCVVSRGDLTKQIGSFIPENPLTAANPKFSVLSNYGKFVSGTSANHDWEMHRNGAVSLSDNGSRIQVARPALTINGDSATDSRLKNTSTTFDIKLGDDSDYKDTDGGTFRARNGKYMKVGSGAGFEFSSSSGGSGSTDTGIFRGSAGRAKVGTATGGTGSGGLDVSNLDLKGSTAFRTRFDPGAPSADRTIIVPNRDLTMVGRAAALTSGQLVKADANGDIVDVGNAAAARALIGLGTLAEKSESSDLALTGFVSIKRPAYLYAEWMPNDTDSYSSDDLDEHNHLIIDASALGGAGTATVNLPEPNTCDGICVVIAIRKEGSGSDYISVQADSGQVTELGTDSIDATTRTSRKYMATAADNIWVRIG